jgi:hypothetical protein
MNRFKKDKNAKYNSWSEFYGNSHLMEWAAYKPELWKSDRVRQEFVFCTVYTYCQPSIARSSEQRDIIWEVRRKNEKIQNNIPLDGTEPSITFEEFAEWNVRYPIN